MKHGERLLFLFLPQNLMLQLVGQSLVPSRRAVVFGLVLLFLLAFSIVVAVVMRFVFRVQVDIALAASLENRKNKSQTTVLYRRTPFTSILVGFTARLTPV